MSEPGQLVNSAVKGVFWRTLESTLGQLLNFAVFLVLARLLSPGEFGIVALGVMLNAVLTVISSFGVTETIVQREKLSQEQLHSYFFLVLVLSLIGYALLLLGVPAVAGFFSEPVLVDVVPWLGLCFVLNAVSAVPKGLLMRRFGFRQLALRTLVSLLLGGVVGVTMAVSGYHFWALVGQQLVTAASSALVLWVSGDWIPKHGPRWRPIAESVRFSANVTGSRLMTIMGRQADNFIIGAYLNTEALGIYSIGFKVYQTATQVVLNSVSAVSLPTFSRLQDNRKKLRSGYRTAISVSAAVALPAFGLLILLADELVPAMFGSQWTGSAPVMQWLMVAACLNTLTHFTTSLLLALDRAGLNFRLTVFVTFINTVAFLIAVRWGIEAVAAGFAAATSLTVPVHLHLVARYTGLSIVRLMASLFPHGMALLALSGAVMLLQAHTPNLSTWPGLALRAAVGLTIYVVALWLLDRRLVADILRLLKTAVSRRRPSGQV